ncbi:GGDEF domain-containing protein [Actinoplanes sp. CA-030573]|uniref:GGDEF domain-containing protein n=1 Tax=Actinoplanes sp. CA-030573 TaxID=3239898 RepID=UPI003D8FDB20
MRNERTGELRQVSVNATVVKASDGSFNGVVLAVQDVHNAVEAERELARQARLDPLTQILNRRGLSDAVDRWSDTRGIPPQAVLVCDINHFKTLNDTYGHAAGDSALRILARVLSECATEHRIAARLGGDEFVVVGWDHLEGLESEIHHALSSEFSALPISEVSVSCGLTLNKSGVALEQLMNQADQLMYERRANKRGLRVA